MAIATNITGGASHQVTFTVTSFALPGRTVVMEFSSVAAASAVDDSDQSSGFVSNISVTLTTTVNNTMLLGAMTASGGGATAGAGFALRHSEDTNLQTETALAATCGSNAMDFPHAEKTAGPSAIALKPN